MAKNMKTNHRSFENRETDMKTIARFAYATRSWSDFQRNRKNLDVKFKLISSYQSNSE